MCTIENDRNESGHFLWQGLKDDYQTYCGIVSFSKGSKDNA